MMKRPRGFADLLSLCLCSRCPVCGTGRLFQSYLAVRRFRELFLPLEHCDYCSFCFAREPGYYFGVLTPTLSILALCLGAAFAGICYFLMRLELTSVLVSGVVGTLIGLVIFFRTSVAVFIAFDHTIDPPSQNKIKGE